MTPTRPVGSWICCDRAKEASPASPGHHPANTAEDVRARLRVSGERNSSIIGRGHYKFASIYRLPRSSRSPPVHEWRFRPSLALNSLTVCGETIRLVVKSQSNAKQILAVNKTAMANSAEDIT